MIWTIPSAVVMYGLFASGLVAATFPAWGWWFFGFNLRRMNYFSFVASDFDGA